MSGIFVSYRRAVSKATTYRFVDELQRHFGEESVFFDIESIAPGVPFAQAINQSLSKSSIALIVIGPDWLNIEDESGQRRLDNPDDWVRREVKAALASNVRVIPLLVEGATMPDTPNLPSELQGLAQLQAFSISERPEYWTFDIQRLVERLRGIDPQLPQKLSGSSTTQVPDKPSFSKKVIAGFIVFVLFSSAYKDNLDSSTALGLVFFFVISFVLFLWGYLDFQKGKVTGKISSIVGMVLAALGILAAYGSSLPNNASPEAIDPATSQQQTETSSEVLSPTEEAVSKAKLAKQLGVKQLVSEQLNIPKIGGVWRNPTGSLKITQNNFQASYIEYNAFGTPVGHGQGSLTDNQFDFEFVSDAVGVSGVGQLFLNAEGTVLSGTITESTTGNSVAVSFYR